MRESPVQFPAPPHVFSVFFSREFLRPSSTKKKGNPYSSVPEPPRLPATLRLQTGQTFAATSFGAPLKGKENKVGGEIVFTTALVGYPESMTDPSYRGQILVFTQPLVGNYGVPGQTRDEFGLLKHFEADGIQVQGIIVSDYAAKYSHWNAVESLGQWCARYGVPALTGVDTRAVVTLLRERGSTLAEICIGDNSPTDLRESAPIETKDPNAKNLVAEASTKTVTLYNPDGDSTILLIDCGAKQNIIRSLAKRGARVMVVPWNFDIASSTFAKPGANTSHAFDGIFLSNGPGNPQAAYQTARNLRAFMQLPQAKTLPMFGICMGNQLMGLAAGFGSYKLKYGNRGHNQPAINLVTGKCVITSQNHGYALDDTSVATGHPVPEDWIPFFRNANDGSNEGIRHVAHPWSSVQFHPEAMGGPLDTDYLFDEFLSDVREYKKRRNLNRLIPDSVCLFLAYVSRLTSICSALSSPSLSCDPSSFVSFASLSTASQ
ncbi:class I glutamine amidotransferase-like protein [Fimicolochytrium jonesii]|uniref:class I glutamine amidotransferase-like protein n=1 Tax=Fimicolochytrium jonesii TaxID=1396493 RepID=UPI0022FE44FB|nr:class I glutamine amidotransferase-like protein [Fimicolochytrium jonesii]KAI8818356.1 class I glutamine amidotransferase-like protein [Fimicolochytrium jonesii]